MRPRKAQEVSRGVVLQRGTYRLVVEPTMVCNVASQDAISRMCGDNVCQTSFIFAWGTCRTVTDLACVEQMNRSQENVVGIPSWALLDLLQTIPRRSCNR